MRYTRFDYANNLIDVGGYAAGTDNKNRYVIATQSLELRKKLRTVPGLPIIYINRSVVLLEAPSGETLSKKKSVRPFFIHDIRFQ